jgi:hypothetical protein
MLVTVFERPSNANGHFLSIVSLFNEQRQKVGTEKVLRQHFFRTQEVYTPGNLDKFLISLATTPVQNVDNGFTVEVSCHSLPPQKSI